MNNYSRTSDTAVSTPDSVAGLIAVRGAGSTNELAFARGEDGTQVTYGRLAEIAERWRRTLAEHELGRGVRVALAVQAPIAFTSTYLSLVAAGVTAVPLDPAAAPAEIADRLELLHATVLVTDREDLERLPCPVWSVDPDAARVSPPRRRERLVTPAPAVLLTSSGTTGVPKVVPLAERQLLYVAAQVTRHHRLDRHDRGYCPLPLYHVNAQVVGLLSTLVSGGSMVLDSKFHRTGYWDRLDEWRITWANAVPAILAILSRGERPREETSARVRFARTGAAPLSGSIRSAFEEWCGVSALETYGMSEAASQITANPLDESLRRTGSAGKPVGIELRVVDEHGRSCPEGVAGSVEIRGPSVIEHYIVPGPEERARRAVDEDGWLVSGDVGFRDADGYVFLTGRADDMINRGGEKVFPREIEDILREDHSVVEVAVVGRPDPVLGECPVAYVIPRDGVEPAELANRLQQLSARRLTPAKRPTRLLVVDSLPAGPTGKISRRRLPDENASTVRAALQLGSARAS
jgi:acyl-CoA synthetase (AMP-forming)/AMP-acid ligase II